MPYMNKTEIQKIFPIGDVMTIREFTKCVECGGFIPYDGYGYYFDEKKKAETKEEVSFDIDTLQERAKKYKHVIWYNR